MQGWTGSDYSKSIVVNEKDHPYTGTNYAWVRARCLGGKTNIWGRLALRLSDYDFKAKSHDGYGEDWPISYADISPYYDKVDLLLGISGVKEHLPQMPDGMFQRPFKLNAAEVKLRTALQKMGRTATPYRAGVTTDGLLHNKYRSKCYGRGACSRRAGGCDIHAAFDSPTGLIYPARDTGRLTIRTNATAHEVQVDPATGKARGVGFVDTVTGKSYAVKARVVVVAASTLESARLLLLSKSPQHPNGLANSSGIVGHHFCEHLMGPRITGLVKERIGAPRTLDDGRPGGFYVPRFRNVTDKHPDFIRGYGFEGGSGMGMMPGDAASAPGFGKAWKKHVRDYAGAFIDMGGFGEVLPRYENSVSLDPVVKDRWGIPVLRFDYRFGDNERKMAADMAQAAQEMFETRGHRGGRRRQEAPHGRVVHPRTRHVAHGHRSEDIGAQPVPAGARREEPVRRRRQQPRQRVVPEPDVDDHGACLAIVRIPGQRAEEGSALDGVAIERSQPGAICSRRRRPSPRRRRSRPANT